MAFVGLTGGIGAGKTEALAAFERLGAATISSDEVVHDLLGDDGMRDLLIERWGDRVAPGGSVDRDEVARIVFENPEELGWLESQLHPRVGERIAAWRSGPAADVAVAVVEVPLLFETGMEGAFDSVVCVVADDSVREQRAAERGHAGLEGRSSRQLSQDEKAARATHVIRNDGSLEELEAQISELWPKLTSAGGTDRRV